MGQYHYLVNLTKKQFVNPHQIGNGLKLAEQWGWEYSTSTVLTLLLAVSHEAKHRLVGSWGGDRVAFIGDYATPDDLPGENAEQINQELEEEDEAPCGKWTNISSEVREMMSSIFDIRYEGDGWLKIETKH